MIDVQDRAYIEAESADRVDGWQQYRDTRAVDGAYMQAWDDDHVARSLEFDVDATGGRYYIWLRVWAAAYSRLGVSVDGGAQARVTASADGESLTGYTWHWRQVPGTFDLNGEHMITVARRRAGNSSSGKLDRLFLTTDSGAEPPELLLLCPNGGERWSPGSEQVITWRSQGDLQGVRIEGSIDGGQTWHTIAPNVPDSGRYVWATPATLGVVRVRISDTGSGQFSMSDGDAWITDDLVPHTAEIIRDRMNLRVSEDPWDQGDRGSYLADVEATGALQRGMAFRNSFNLGHRDDNEPDDEALAAFRSGNESKTVVIAYNNLYSIPAGARGESMMGNVSTHADWFLYDTSGNMVHNALNGRDCFNFRNREFLDYIIARARMYHSAGINGMEFDCFDVLRKHIFENGYWFSTHPPYANPIIIADPDTGREYMAEDWIRDLSAAVRYICASLPDGFLLFVNGCDREVFSEFGEEIDGYFAELFAGVSKRKATVGDWWFRSNRFERDVDGLATLDLAGKHTVLGCGHVTGDSWTQTQDQAALYCVAAALLGIATGAESKMYLRPIGWNESTMGADLLALKLARFVPLSRHERLDNGVFRREFAHALVYTNPTQTTTAMVSLDEPMYYIQDDGVWSSDPVEQLEIGPGRGAIFVRDKDWLPSESEPPEPEPPPARNWLVTVTVKSSEPPDVNVMEVLDDGA